MTSITLSRSHAHDGELQVAALRAGDEHVFAALVDECHPLMMLLAQSLTSTSAAAEEVVHDAWLDVLEGLDGFEGRSSLRAWVLRVLVNRTTLQGASTGRPVPEPWLDDAEDGPSVDPERFLPDDHPHSPGQWATPATWGDDAEVRLLGDRMGGLLREAIDVLPAGERAVVTLRDIQGWSSDEVDDALTLSPVEQRRLLHHGRSTLRQALEVSLATAA